MCTTVLISGANILVGAFTVTVIAIDRWKSVANTNPNAAPLNYTRAFAVIAAVWLLAFLGETEGQNMIP